MMKARRFSSIILSLFLALSLTACGGNDSQTSTRSSGGQTASNASQDNQKTESTVQSSTDTGTSSEIVSGVSADDASKEQTAQSKTLVLYFSAANLKDTDAISSATPTQQLATLIHNEVGGDLVKIIPTNDYPLSYDETANKAKDERDNDERPSFEPLSVNIEDYDTIYIGYPMWWYTVPMIINTFFDTYDFSGKTIIPFNTHAGSGDGGTYNTIRELESSATVKNGLAISGESVFDDSTKQQVKDWIARLE